MDGLPLALDRTLVVAACLLGATASTRARAGDEQPSFREHAACIKHREAGEHVLAAERCLAAYDALPDTPEALEARSLIAFDTRHSFRDAYAATHDDMPDPPAIFEGDCSNAGNSYKWARLNWRDPMAEPCKYLQNPWAPMWTAGPHSVEFSYHESPALGRILLTTDPNLVPK